MNCYLPTLQKCEQLGLVLIITCIVLFVIGAIWFALRWTNKFTPECYGSFPFEKEYPYCKVCPHRDNCKYHSVRKYEDIA